MSTVELRHLHALIAVAEEGTFTDAAIRLGVTQSAVSRTVVALEELVGTRLIERTTRSLALTQRGTMSYYAALIAVAAIDDVIVAAQGRVRPLRLGFAWSALGARTTEVLRSWRTDNPAVPLEVHRFDDVADGLLRGAVDIMVIRGELDDPRIETYPVFREGRLAALPAAHPLAARDSLQLLDLVDDTVLITANGTTTLALWPPDHQPRASLHVDNIDEWLTEIAGGLAVGVTPEATATQHAHPGIRFVPLVGAPPVTVYLGWLSSRRHPATTAFVGLVERVVSRG